MNLKNFRWRGGRIFVLIIAVIINIFFFSHILCAQNPPAEATRSIFPHQIERGESFEVTVNIKAYEPIAGLALDEDLEGFEEDWSPWQITSIKTDGAGFNPGEVAWIWLTLSEGETKQVIYQVTTSFSTPPGTYTISGTCCSKSPSFEQKVSGDYQITIQDTQPPPPVSGFSIMQGDENGEIDLRWDENTCPDFLGTLILRNSEAPPTVAPSNGVKYTSGDTIGGCKVVYAGEKTSFTDSGLTDNTVYYYRAFSFDDVYNYSEGVPSNPEGLTPRDTIPPDNITGLQAVAGDGKIDLSWINPQEDWRGTRIMRKEDTFPLNPNDGTLVYTGVANSYTDSPLTNNTTYYYTAFAYDEVPNYSQAVSTAQAFATPEDKTPPSIIHEPLKSATKDENLIITANITDTSPLSFTKVCYREGGNPDYNSIPMEQGSSYRATIPSTYVTERGLEYYIEAEDTNGNIATLPETEASVSPYTVRVNFSSLPFPFTTKEGKWQMISVPADLDNPFLDSVLIDDLGTQDNTKWKLYRWNTANGSYDEYPNIPDNFTPGKAFWLITKDSKNIDVGQGKSVDTSSDYVIDLDPGWNQIASSFAFNIDWNNVKVRRNGETVSIKQAQANGWIRDTIWYWDGDKYTFHQAPDGVLKPWEGYWVKALELCELLIPPLEEGENKALAFSKNIQKYLQIIAKVGELKDSYNFIGLSCNAKDSYDRKDIEEAPPISPYISLSFPHSDWGKDSGSYTQDIREARIKNKSYPEKITWDMQVKTDRLNKVVTLEWKNTDAIPKEYNLYLTDEDENVLSCMREKNNYSF
ncbi:hypothetical protein J7K97_01115, partial [Candidatus Aerophobetes bacterium]|nr:hypothetical protein [Candidatus Aerophobetes bacterium]